MKRAALLLLLVSAPRPAAATGFTDAGQDILAAKDSWFQLSGALRVRGEAFDNLDLDRGLTPSGLPLFPVPIADPSGQWIEQADLRLRTDLAAYAPFGLIAVKLRVDVLDNLKLGGAPEGNALATTSQSAPIAAFRVKRAYGEVLTPLGLLAAGRMGAHFGTGMFVNGGDCADCDSGDAADRIAFVTAIGGLLWAAALDLSSTGPSLVRPTPLRPIDLDPADDTKTISFSVLRYSGDLARARRRSAGKSTVEAGLLGSYRWQNDDLTPAATDGSFAVVTPTPAQVIDRGYKAFAADAWLRLTFPFLRVEGEAVLLTATIDQASLIPGVQYRDPVRSQQIGAVLESETGEPGDDFAVGLDLGYASGDPAPGFGAAPANLHQPQPGDLDGLQLNPPHDTRVDNFRFHPDYRIDRILFREIIGTVTDALYARPHARWALLRSRSASLTAHLAVIASMAAFAESTPGGKQPLGIEVDPTLAFESTDGFLASLEHAVLFPLAGLDNPILNLPAKPAQLIRLRLTYVF
jgi:uncharacterized protein (TIGR04551 family)